MKKLNCAVTAFVVFLLQSTVLPFIFNGVSQPNLIFVFVVLAALRHGQRFGIGTALLGGFCQDVVIGNFFGVHILPYLVLAFLCGYIGRHVDRDQSIVTILLVLGATEVNLLLTGGVLALTGQYVHIVSYLVEFSVPMLLYHGVLTPFADRAVSSLHREEGMYGYIGYRG